MRVYFITHLNDFLPHFVILFKNNSNFFTLVSFDENLSPDEIEEFETAFHSFKSNEVKQMKNKKVIFFIIYMNFTHFRTSWLALK